MYVKQTDRFLAVVIYVVLGTRHWGVSLYTWSEIVVAVIIAVIFDYLNEKHSGTEEGNYIKLL